jgi:hypothetical protein
MRILKATGLSIAAIATLTVGIAPALARPHHDQRHQVCKMERNHGHGHGHAKRVCHWVG